MIENSNPVINNPKTSGGLQMILSKKLMISESKIILLT